MDVTFTWQGKIYSGELRKVNGAASAAMYHLMVKDYYQGQLVRTDHGWTFSTQRHGRIPDVAVQLARYLT